MKHIYKLFSNFSFCRRKLGGTWYQVYHEWNESGLGWEASIIWTQNKPAEYNFQDDMICKILKIENY